MSYYRIPHPVLTLALALLLVCSALLTPSHKPIAVAQISAPAECITDEGKELVPEDPNYWLLLLNFNHPLRDDATTGCFVYFNPGDSHPQYELVECPLQNNQNGVLTGDGMAKFDGNLWIECMPRKTERILSHFYIEASAQFGATGLVTILDHPNVAMQANIDKSWHVTLTSRYGLMSPASNYDPNSSAYDTTVRVISWMGASNTQTLGYHTLNGVRLDPSFAAPTFVFDDQVPLRIGSSGALWSANEIIIDPRFCALGC